MTGRWRQAVRAENCGDPSLDNLVARRYDRGGEPGSLVGLSWCAMTRLLLPDRSSVRDRLASMRRRSLSTSRAHGVRRRCRAYGSALDHPLLHASEAVHYTGRQWVHVAAVLTGGVIARIEGLEWAGPLAGSAASVLLILRSCLPCTSSANGTRDRVDSRGREGIPIAAVQRQRRRLLAEQTRNGLAGNLEDLIRQSASRSRLQMRVTPLPFEPTVLRMAAGELREVSGLLRTEGVSARGVARAERLVERAVSPLYGQDADALARSCAACAICWRTEKPDREPSCLSESARLCT